MRLKLILNSHHIDLDAQVCDQVEDMADVVFGDEGKVQCTDRKQALVWFYRYQRRIIVSTSLEIRVPSAGSIKGLHIEWNAFILQRLDCFGVNHLRAVVGHFDGIFAGEAVQFTTFSNKRGSAVKHARHIFPDGHVFCIQTKGKDGCRIVRPPGRG